MTGNKIGYYVYLHIDPETKEIVYIGKGSGGRAWDVTRDRNHHIEHLTWMKNLISKGFLPCDWVEIKSKSLSDAEARKEELKLLHNQLTKFNRQSGERQHQAKLTNEQVINIYKRVHNKEKPVDLAKEFGVSKAAVYMIANRKQWKSVTAGVEI